MIPSINCYNPKSREYHVGFGANSAAIKNAAAGHIESVSQELLMSLKSAYKDIYSKIGILKKSDLAVASQKLKGAELLGKEEGILFKGFDSQTTIQVSMPNLNSFSDEIKLISRKGNVEETILESNGKIRFNNSPDFLSEKEIKENQIEKKISKFTEMIDFPLLKLRMGITKDKELLQKAEKLKEERRAFEKAEALRQEIINKQKAEAAIREEKRLEQQREEAARIRREQRQKEREMTVRTLQEQLKAEDLYKKNLEKLQSKTSEFANVTNQKPSKIKEATTKNEVVNKTKTPKPIVSRAVSKNDTSHTLVKTASPEDVNETPKVKKKRVFKEGFVRKPPAPKRELLVSYHNSLFTPLEAFYKARDVQKNLSELNKEISKYSSYTQVEIRKRYPNYYYTFENSVIEFKNVGDKKLRLAFRLGKYHAATRDFYNLAVFEGEDKLMKSFVSAPVKTVDSLKSGYPIRSFLPDGHRLVEKEEQAEFLKYLDMLNEEINKFKDYVLNKRWRLR